MLGLLWLCWLLALSRSLDEHVFYGQHRKKWRGAVSLLTLFASLFSEGRQQNLLP